MEHTNVVSYALTGDYDPTKPVLIDAANPTRYISRKKAAHLIASLAGSFEPDSTVVLHIANDITYPVLVHAIYASNCRWTGTNPAYKVPELEHHFKVSEAKYIITNRGHLDTVRAAVELSGTNAEIIIFTDILESHFCNGCFRCCGHARFSGGKAYRTLRDLQHVSCVATLPERLSNINPDSIASLNATSGTTGRPKMAARTHRAILAEAMAAMDNHPKKGYEVGRLYCTPIFHAFSTPDMVINSLRTGIPSYFMGRFDDKLFPEKVAQFQITETFGLPPMLLRFINNPECHAKLQSLKAIFSGGAPLAPELHTRLMGIFTYPPRVVQVYGMTEGGWFATLKAPETDNTHSAGRALPGSEVKMSCEDQSVLDNGQIVSQLYFRGPGLMNGYYNNPEATADAFDREGWLKTGDIGYVKEGKVYIVDRVKDLIKVNGWQVSPSELEDALLVSQHVKDCGVIGVGKAIDEHPLAFVVLADEGKDVATPAMIKEHLRSRLVSYKVNCTEIRFVGSIPKSPPGKILKNKLREWATQ